MHHGEGGSVIDGGGALTWMEEGCCHGLGKGSLMNGGGEESWMGERWCHE